jgi:hypothetical protein
MADVNIQIDAQGNASGINQLKNEYDGLIQKVRRLYSELDRGIQNTSQSFGDWTEVMSNNVSATRTGGRIIRGISRRAMRYGSAAIGIAGGYSLLSNIAGELGGVDQRNLAYATALSATRGRQGLDYSIKKPFFEIQKLFEDLGQTIYATSKDMEPMLEVAKELADFSGGRKGTTGGRLAGAVNIGKALGVDSETLSQLFTGGLRSGAFRGGGDYVEITKMMMLNQNMMHRASEAIQAMSQVISSTTHGAQGIGAFGIFNLLDTLNSSKNRAYRGAGGASALMRIDQAFRGGGDESFQYMQTLALNPAFQARNARLARESAGVRKQSTNWQSGSYDQLISDVMKDLGAFATPQDLIKTLSGMGISDVEGYIKEMYGGGMNKMNIQRLYDVYSNQFGANASTGKKFFMQMQMAKSMGVKPSDIGVIGEALQNETFMARAKEGKLDTGEYAAAFRSFQKGGKGGLEDWFQKRSENQESFIDIAKGIRSSVDTIKDIANEYLKPAGEVLKEWLPEMAKTLVEQWGSPDQKKDIAIKRMQEMGVGFTAQDYYKAQQSNAFKEYSSGYKFIDMLLPMGRRKFHEGVSGINPMMRGSIYDVNRSPMDFPSYRDRQPIPMSGIDKDWGLLAPIVNAIKEGFKSINVTYPRGTTPMEN